MTLSWDASASPDVAMYVLAAMLAFQFNEEPVEMGPWADATWTVGLSLPDPTPTPPVGGCYMFDVAAVDRAGNRSPRGEAQ